MRRVTPELDLTTIAGSALMGYAATGFWLGRFSVADIAPWLTAGEGGTLIGLRRRRVVLTNGTPQGAVVPVSEARTSAPTRPPAS